MTTYSKHYAPKNTPQSEEVPGKNQVQNNAGGFGFQVDKWSRLDRFLILGSDANTYYAKARALTLENAAAVIECLNEDTPRVVAKIVDVSLHGKAPKNDPAIFALALACSKDAVISPFDAIPKVCRTGTHLFQFMETIKAIRGFGSGLRKAIGKWYTDRPARDLAYQVTKYQQRGGWTHRDVLRVVHPDMTTGIMKEIAHYITKGWDDVGDVPHQEADLIPIWAMERAKRATTAREIVSLIRDHRLVRECIPTQWLNDIKVWEALLDEMPMAAMLRNLGKMSSLGLLDQMSDGAKLVADRLQNRDFVRKSRLHPLNILVAMRTYSKGSGVKGSLSWNANRSVVDALDEAFYISFENVEPTGKKTMLALDVSGSMTSDISGMPLTCREAETALALVTDKVEENTSIFGFCTEFKPLALSKKQRLDDAMRYIDSLVMGGTDCALPMVYATNHKLEVETFIIYTDCETWRGNIHPFKALENYRQKMGIPAKLIVVGMVSNGFTIADPNDAGSLDIVGFSTDTPQIISCFSGAA